MSKGLRISDDLTLPIDLAARTQCIFAQKGAGKTYAAGVQAEEMLDAGVQICVLDPTGVWWGLQSTASGGKGSHDIIVMGGGHADVPLEPDAGEIVANFLVETGQSVVLDVSHFESEAAQDRFALALATKLYRLKAHDKANIHIFLDEADQFCPMKPQKGQERLLHAWDLIVRLGRSRGLGLTAISNRPAVVHTNIRNNVDLLTCLRITGPHDFKAVKDWTSINATVDQAKEFLESVPTLPDGEAWFWSPSWLRVFKRAKIRTKHSFDSSRTPKPGERAVEPKERRTPDLQKLTQQIRASVEKAKATDPKELQKQVRELKAELAKKPAPAAAPLAEVKIKEKFVLKDGQLDRAEKLIARMMDALLKAGELQLAVKTTADEITAAIRQTHAPASERKTFVAQRHTSVPQRATASPPVTHKPTVTTDGALPEGQRIVLTAIAQYPQGVERDQLSVLTGYKRSTRDAYLQRLRNRAFIHDGSMITATQEGIDALGDFEPLPTGDSLRAYWMNRLPEGERKVLEVVASVYPDAITREALEEPTGFKRSTRDAYIQRLTARRLVESIGRGEVKASENLFD